MEGLQEFGNWIVGYGVGGFGVRGVDSSWPGGADVEG